MLLALWSGYNLTTYTYRADLGSAPTARMQHHYPPRWPNSANPISLATDHHGQRLKVNALHLPKSVTLSTTSLSLPAKSCQVSLSLSFSLPLILQQQNLTMNWSPFLKALVAWSVFKCHTTRPRTQGLHLLHFNYYHPPCIDLCPIRWASADRRDTKTKKTHKKLSERRVKVR